MVSETDLKMFTREAMAAFQADNEYADAHFKEWLAAYRDQWVVVKDRELLLVTPDEYEVIDACKQHGPMTVVRLMRPWGFQDATTQRPS